MYNLSKDEINQIKSQYLSGMRVELVYMDDPQAPPIGAKGTVIVVDDAGQLIVRWDTGVSLSLIPKKDKWRIVERQSLKQFILEHPDCSFDLYTPGGFAYLNPQEALQVLDGENIKGHLAEPDSAVSISSQELMSQYVFSAIKDSSDDYLFNVMTCLNKGDDVTHSLMERR